VSSARSSIPDAARYAAIIANRFIIGVKMRYGPPPITSTEFRLGVRPEAGAG